MGAPDAMSTRWHIGAKHLRGAIAAYAKRFDLLEVRVAQSAPGESAEAPPGPVARHAAPLAQIGASRTSTSRSSPARTCRA